MFQKMGLVFFLILISASLSSCKFATNTQTPNTLVNACDPINGIQNIISTDQPQILVFGEVHGTKESPEFIRDVCLLYTSPSPRDRTRSRMPSSA